MKQELGNLMAEDPQQETINLLTYRLNAVTVERDEWKAKYIQQNKDLGCEMMDPNGTIWDYAKKLQTELAAVTEQRDRLAEALREVATYDPSDGQCNSGYSCKYIAEQALRSLNPDHTVDANDMIAAVKGGSHE